MADIRGEAGPSSPSGNTPSFSPSIPFHALTASLSGLSASGSSALIQRSQRSCHTGAGDPPSPTTAGLIRLGVHSQSLDGLDTLIDKHPSFEQAKIRSTRTCRETAGPIPHRFLVLELRIGHADPFWMRLDRLRDANVTNWRFCANLFSTRANDEVDITATEAELRSPSSIEENCQTFRKPPSLRCILRYLHVFSVESPNYEAFQRNCWFLCSALQEHLEKHHGGRYVRGHSLHADWARDTRRRIEKRLVQPPRPLILHPTSTCAASALISGPFPLVAGSTRQRKPALPAGRPLVLGNILDVERRQTVSLGRKAMPNFARLNHATRALANQPIASSRSRTISTVSAIPTLVLARPQLPSVGDAMANLGRAAMSTLGTRYSGPPLAIVKKQPRPLAQRKLEGDAPRSPAPGMIGRMFNRVLRRPSAPLQ